MPTVTAETSTRVNYIFVDFENVRNLDLSLIGSKAVHFTLLLGSKDKKLDVSVVEKLWEHAASVQLVRLDSAGRNALDFALAYYVGRAVMANPTAHFHIVAKDKGYDPLIEHLVSKNIRAHRHDDFATLSFLSPAKPPSASPPPAAAPKPQRRPKAQPPILDERATQVLDHLCEPSATRPKNREKLVSFVVAHLGHKITEAEALAIVESLRQAGHITLGEKGAVAYQLESR